MTESQDKINEIRERVSRTSLHIGSIPEKTKTEFMELAKAEFDDHYGMCIKWLLDFRNGLLSNPNQILNEKIEFLAEQVRQLQVKEQPTKKMLSGKELKRRNEQNEQTISPSGQTTSI